MKKFLVIDNYDSFTYNLIHIFEEILGHEVDVLRNDMFALSDVDAYTDIVISPGPGVPSEAGLTKDVIQQYHRSKRILGVCLGLQSIGEVFGGTLKNLKEVYHGMQTDMILTKVHSPLFNDIPKVFKAGRYHSWVIDALTFPEDLEITCIDDTREIMAAQHKLYPTFGVQFHPESILTPDGVKMIKNFIDLPDQKKYT